MAAAACTVGLLPVCARPPAPRRIAGSPIMATGGAAGQRPPIATRAGAGDPPASSSSAPAVDATLNARVAALRPSKTMALTDLARSLREGGADIIGLAAGEPDFDTPAAVVEAGVEALR